MSEKTPEQYDQCANELEQIKTVILGENNERITQTVKSQAREIVSDVLTEALHDREKNDGSVNKVLMPLVENAVENSVNHRSDRLVSSLYPLMGSLVRKSVAAFLADFMEKTNKLIENSFTWKGLSWRIKAWQAGVSFTQYVISQTYNYRVEHVLLIHQETGLLLNSVNLDNQTHANADLISSMLSAINDFVGDSFQTNQDGLKEQLQTVTTDNFKLLIKPGPNAIIVAAITGNPPNNLSEQLQETLEDIHQLYTEELAQFNGDDQPFENCAAQLRDCLLSEEKEAESKQKKKPWLAWLIVAVITLMLVARMVNFFQLSLLEQKIMMLDNEPGIVINKVDVLAKDNIELDVLRDPNAANIADWFKSQGLSYNNVALSERAYLSLAPAIAKIRIDNALNQFTQLTKQWHQQRVIVAGEVSISEYQQIQTLKNEESNTSVQIDTTKLVLTNNENLFNSSDAAQQLFYEIVGKISAMQIDFAIGSESVDQDNLYKLQQLNNQFELLKNISTRLNKSIGLVIMGTSDNSGNKDFNNQLSIKRATNTAQQLINLGIKQEQMFITGLGQINIDNIQSTSRKVIFNVIYVDSVKLNTTDENSNAVK